MTDSIAPAPMRPTSTKPTPETVKVGVEAPEAIAPPITIIAPYNSR